MKDPDANGDTRYPDTKLMTTTIALAEDTNIVPAQLPATVTIITLGDVVARHLCPVVSGKRSVIMRTSLWNLVYGKVKDADDPIDPGGFI